MASVKVFPKFQKAKSDGKVPIYLRVTKNRKSRYVALDVYVSLVIGTKKPARWNQPQTMPHKLTSTFLPKWQKQKK